MALENMNSILIQINGLNTNGTELTKELTFQYKDGFLSVKKMIEEVFEKTGLKNDYKLIDVYVTNKELENNNIKIDDLEFGVFNRLKYILNVRLSDSQTQVIFYFE